MRPASNGTNDLVYLRPVIENNCDSFFAQLRSRW